MNIQQTKENGTLTFQLEGRLDTTTAPQFEQPLLNALSEADAVVIDFAKVNYVSSAGLRVLMKGQKTALGYGKTLTLKNVIPEIMEVFDMTGFTDLLTFA